MAIIYGKVCGCCGRIWPQSATFWKHDDVEMCSICDWNPSGFLWDENDRPPEPHPDDCVCFVCLEEEPRKLADFEAEFYEMDVTVQLGW